jgi:hypothetical protein
VTRLDKALTAIATALILFACSTAGCATAKTCTQPLKPQAFTDGAAVLACAAQGTPIETCEMAQLANEEAQLSQDVLVCAETAVAKAARK